MNNQEYLEFVAILEDTRNRVETVLSELPVTGATKAWSAAGSVDRQLS